MFEINFRLGYILLSGGWKGFCFLLRWMFLSSLWWCICCINCILRLFKRVKININGIRKVSMVIYSLKWIFIKRLWWCMVILKVLNINLVVLWLICCRYIEWCSIFRRLRVLKWLIRLLICCICNILRRKGILVCMKYCFELLKKLGLMN